MTKKEYDYIRDLFNELKRNKEKKFYCRMDIEKSCDIPAECKETVTDIVENVYDKKIYSLQRKIDKITCAGFEW